MKEAVSMELRLAQQHEAGICYQCIEDARAYHKSLGFEQWHPDYPTQQTIFDDISRGIGYAFTDDTGVIGYCCIVIGDMSAPVAANSILLILPLLSFGRKCPQSTLALHPHPEPPQ